MWLKDGKYDSQVHHNSHLAVGVPGTVAGLHLAWKTSGSKPWKDLVAPAVKLARDGFELSDALARSLERTLPSFKRYPASCAQFSKNGTPYQAGEIFKQPDLARTPAAHRRPGTGGLLRRRDGGAAREGDEGQRRPHHARRISRTIRRSSARRSAAPIAATTSSAWPPPSSGGISVQLMLNILEGHDLKAMGSGSAQTLHLLAESMRRAFAERAQHLGDPDFVKTMPIDRLISKDYAAQLRKTINPTQASKSSPTTFSWTTESQETTHFSIVDAQRNAVSMTYTLEASYGSKIIAPGTGFLLNNEMGDFNAGPGLTTEQGLIGTEAEPRAARQADAVEHVADDHRQGRQAVHGDRHARRPHHHQHGADDDPQRHRLRDERAGSGRCGPHPPPVAAGSHQLRGARVLARHDRAAARRWATRCSRAAPRAWTK